MILVFLYLMDVSNMFTFLFVQPHLPDRECHKKPNMDKIVYANFQPMRCDIKQKIPLHSQRHNLDPPFHYDSRARKCKFFFVFLNMQHHPKFLSNFCCATLTAKFLRQNTFQLTKLKLDLCTNIYQSWNFCSSDKTLLRTLMSKLRSSFVICDNSLSKYPCKALV